MNLRSFFSILLATMLLTGCGTTRQATNYVDDFLVKYGDDLARYSSRNVDDAARQASEINPYLDDITRNIPPRIEEAPGILRYTNRARLTPLQEDALHYFQTQHGYDFEEAALFLDGICHTLTWIELLGKYPSAEFSQEYTLYVAGRNGIPLSSVKDFVELYRWYTDLLIQDDRYVSQEEAIEMTFKGLCLFS